MLPPQKASLHFLLSSRSPFLAFLVARFSFVEDSLHHVLSLLVTRDVEWCDVTLRNVTWRDVEWCDVAWHYVMWLGVTLRDVTVCDIMWRYVTLCNITWRYGRLWFLQEIFLTLPTAFLSNQAWHCVLWREVMWHYVLWRYVMWRDMMGEFWHFCLTRRYIKWRDVMLHNVKCDIAWYYVTWCDVTFDSNKRHFLFLRPKAYSLDQLKIHKSSQANRMSVLNAKKNNFQSLFCKAQM